MQYISHIFCILDLLLLCHFSLLFKALLIHLSATIMSNWEGVWKEREGKRELLKQMKHYP